MLTGEEQCYEQTYHTMTQCFFVMYVPTVLCTGTSNTLKSCLAIVRIEGGLLMGI